MCVGCAVTRQRALTKRALWQGWITDAMFGDLIPPLFISIQNTQMQTYCVTAAAWLAESAVTALELFPCCFPFSPLPLSLSLATPSTGTSLKKQNKTRITALARKTGDSWTEYCRGSFLLFAKLSPSVASVPAVHCVQIGTDLTPACSLVHC